MRILLLLISLMSAACDAKEAKMSKGFEFVQQANTAFSVEELKFIESAMVKAGAIKDFDHVIASHLRIFILKEDAQTYSVHVGSKNPNLGGSGANYSVKKDGSVKLESTETIAPAPKS